jgi:hypothetical protein
MVRRLLIGVAVICASLASLAAGANWHGAQAAGGSIDATVQQDSTRISYVVFHAVDRDGFCDAAAFGAVSLHPVLTDAPNDTIINGTTGLPNPRATLDVVIDSGEGIITETSDGPTGGTRSVTGLTTFSTYDNAAAGSPIKAFPPLQDGAVDECQAWVKVVSSLPTPANVFLVFHDDTGDIGFDKVVNGAATATVSLTPRWSLVTWSGADQVAVKDALAGTGAAQGGSDVSGAISAIYAWDATAARWLAYFPGADAVPGANTLQSLANGQAYWIAVNGSSPVSWSIVQPPQ